jgi:hypothetical protein
MVFSFPFRRPLTGCGRSLHIDVLSCTITSYDYIGLVYVQTYLIKIIFMSQSGVA